MVEHMDGSSGMIVRRGSNYVSFETEDGLIKKAWLYDLQEGPRIPRKKGQPAGSDKHSDLYTDENPKGCLLYTSPSPRDDATSRMPSSA